ncbi:MAG: sigma-70 family RNA polymerase sigma factor [Alphaproteobacteria bacterium]|nr:sigma-70 family RNA polymerase sigma factor [Alphaproteobacteria bacterium]MDD9920367.1 sigma-70 family RNA polymerase sigma factor [Alphaproteobacteria bacterium]
MENTELQQLMLSTAKGDEKAFRQLAQAVGQGAYGLAYRLLNGDTASAEDAVQEMLIKLWQTAPRWEPKGSVKSYVYRLTYTTCMDKLRKNKPVTELTEDFGTPETATNQIFTKQRQDHIYEALNKLPERQRSAVVLTYLQEMPQKDVADTLGTSVKAVESLLIRAKQALRQTTAREWIGDVS